MSSGMNRQMRFPITQLRSRSNEHLKTRESREPEARAAEVVPFVKETRLSDPWDRMPDDLTNRRFRESISTYWFMEGLVCPPELGHPAHRRAVPRGRVFNPGVTLWRGRLYFACRMGSDNLSSIWIGRLNDDLQPLRGSFVEAIPYDCGESYEDPRLLVHRDRLLVSCSVAIDGENWQCLAELDEYLRVVSFCRFSRKVGRQEKNWIFFSHADQLHCIYHAGRGAHEVHLVQDSAVIPTWETRSPVCWRWGEIHGGTNPVLIGSEYWTFFHSGCSLENAYRYFMGAYVFESAPPFRIVAYTPDPLYTPSAPSSLWTPPGTKHVIFPSGLLLNGDEFVIFSGYNDEGILVFRLPAKRMVSLMIRH